jgi:uncharacterized protein (TIGR01777 family)
MRVLITGVTGFIGSTLARRLQANGHEVVGLTRDVAKANRRLPMVEGLHTWNMGEEPSMALLQTADAVVNLAGETVAGRWTKGKKQRIYESRVSGTRNLVSAMRKAGGPGVLVSASAVGYYGDRGDEELRESAGLGTGFLADVCRDWEAEAFEALGEGTRVAVMRLGIVLGRGGGALKPLLPLFNVGLGGRLGSGSQWGPWVHIDDVASALATAVEEPYQGAFNLVAPEPVRQGDFARELGRAVHRPAVLPVPGFALRLIQGEFADEVLFSKRVVPAHLETNGFSFQHPLLAEALADVLSGETTDEVVSAGS